MRIPAPGESVCVLARELHGSACPRFFHFVGHRSSIRRKISSAQRMASAIAVNVAGTLAPPSYWASFRAAKIEAAISNARFRPSSTNQDYHLSPCIRHVNHDNIYMHQMWCMRVRISYDTTKGNNEICHCDKSGLVQYSTAPPRFNVAAGQCALHNIDTSLSQILMRAKLRNEGT